MPTVMYEGEEQPETVRHTLQAGDKQVTVHFVPVDWNTEPIAFHQGTQIPVKYLKVVEDPDAQ